MDSLYLVAFLAWLKTKKGWKISWWVVWLPFTWELWVAAFCFTLVAILLAIQLLLYGWPHA